MSSVVIGDDELWAGLDDYMTARHGGPMGIAKMMQQPSDEAARAAWLGWVRPILTAWATRLSLVSEGMAVVSVGSDVRIQFTVSNALVDVHGDPRVRAFGGPRVAPIGLVAVGQQRWGSEWEEVLLARACDRRIVPNSTSNSPELFPWLAPNPKGFGPYILADSERSAQLAVRAEEFGWEWVSGLFDEFEGSRG